MQLGLISCTDSYIVAVGTVIVATLLTVYTISMYVNLKISIGN